MVSIRSILTAITFFTAFVFAAPTAETDLAKRDSNVVGDIVQYLEKLSSDIQGLTGDFEKLAGEAVQDASSDISNVVGEIEGLFKSNTTIQGLISELNPAGISSGDIQQLAGAAISLVRDLLSFIPTAASWIIQAKSGAQGTVQQLLSLPQELIQFVLTLLGQLASLVPAFGTAIEFFVDLLKSAESTLYNLL